MWSPAKEVRERNGWSRNQFAELLNTTPMLIGKLEKGKMRLPASFYGRLRELRIDPFQLAVDQERFIA